MNANKRQRDVTVGRANVDIIGFAIFLLFGLFFAVWQILCLLFLLSIKLNVVAQNRLLTMRIVNWSIVVLWAGINRWFRRCGNDNDDLCLTIWILLNHRRGYNEDSGSRFGCGLKPMTNCWTLSICKKMFGLKCLEETEKVWRHEKKSFYSSYFMSSSHL